MLSSAMIISTHGVTQNYLDNVSFARQMSGVRAKQTEHAHMQATG